MPFVDTPAPKPVIVLLCGFEEHGKTTAAKWLAARHGFARTSFADPIRAALIDAWGVPADAFRRENKSRPCPELGGRTPREAMQSLGDWGRAIDLEFWVKAWDRRLPETPLVVVDDARYDLEPEYARDVARRRGAAFVMAHVYCPDAGPGTNHGSNRIPVAPRGCGLTPVLRNDGTPEHLGLALERVLREAGCL